MEGCAFLLGSNGPARPLLFSGEVRKRSGAYLEPVSKCRRRRRRLRPIRLGRSFDSAPRFEDAYGICDRTNGFPLPKDFWDGFSFLLSGYGKPRAWTLF